jgi:hypothetical protein
MKSADEYDRILREEGPEAFVAKLVADYGPAIALGGDRGERLFRHVRLGHIAGKGSELERIYTLAMLNVMPPELQAIVIKDLPKHIHDEIAAFGALPWWKRVVLNLLARRAK